MKTSSPNLFIIGAPKAGTTALVTSLKEHPEIFVPNNKELRFFDAHIFYDHEEDYPLKNMKEYLEKYAGNEAEKSKYRVDGSVFNMYSMESIHNILKLSPNAKFIVMIRDPLTAVKSMFSQRLKYVDPLFREVTEEFSECWRLMQARKNGKKFPSGCRNKFLFRYDLLYSYEKYLPSIIQEIKSDNLYIGSYTLLNNMPEVFYSQILAFLDLNRDFRFSNKKMNESSYLEVNFYNKCIEDFTRKSYDIRRKLGLYGERVYLLKKLLFGNKSIKGKLSNSCDEDIRRFFRLTYKYLESINVKL